MKKISIVVPVYNVEEYLRKCIESIMAQTFVNIEIILVDDGSTDESGNICDEYSNIDSRIQVLHKCNGGLSSARNAGIDIATGEFIGFIDSDDWIEPDYFQILYDGIISNAADISVMHFSRVVNFDKIDFITSKQSNWIKLDRFKAMESLMINNFIGYSAVNKLYRITLFDNIRYPEGMLMEDKATTYKLIQNSNFIVVNSSRKYHYYLRVDSIIRSKFNRKNFDSFIIHDELIIFIDENYPELSSLVRGRYVHTSIRMLLVMIRSNYVNRSDYKICTNVIRGNLRYAIKERRIKFSVKLLGVLTYLFPYIPYYLGKSRIASLILHRQKLG